MSDAVSIQHVSGPFKRRRIAVLLANNDVSSFSSQHPSDAEKVCTLLRTQRPGWMYDIYSVKDGIFPTVAAADGFVITGSPASVHDPLPWIRRLVDFVHQLDEHRVKLVGICFGHQLIAQALGGEVSRNPGGWRFGVAETQYIARTQWMSPVSPQLLLYACHSEQVSRLPPEALRLGGDAFCPIGSFACGRHILTTEYHPEFTRPFMHALADAYRGEVPDAVLETGCRQLMNPVHSEVFAKWMVQFFSDGDAT